jgi:acyl-coenzyme A synthetase/AMP-(fatty) acid ligase
MLYISLRETSKKFANKLAVNDLTYSQLYDLALSRPYTKVCHDTGISVLLDIIKAMSENKPIVILPKENREGAIIPAELPDHFGIVLYSSGSTGVRKPIFLTESMMVANAKSTIDFQRITSGDRFLNVCSLNHTAGINCHTIPGLLTGAYTVIETFNGFNCLRLLKELDITATHLVPMMTEVLMKVEAKPNLPKLNFVITGSDCIPKHHVEYWLDEHRDMMITYGMTEVGPPAIGHIFKHGDDLSCFDNGYPVGSHAFCETKIVGGELWLKGPIVNQPDWFKTGDCFKHENGFYYYTGRVSAGGKIIPKGKN